MDARQSNILSDVVQFGGETGHVLFALVLSSLPHGALLILLATCRALRTMDNLRRPPRNDLHQTLQVLYDNFDYQHTLTGAAELLWSSFSDILCPWMSPSDQALRLTALPVANELLRRRDRTRVDLYPHVDVVRGDAPPGAREEDIYAQLVAHDSDQVRSVVAPPLFRVITRLLEEEATSWDVKAMLVQVLASAFNPELHGVKLPNAFIRRTAECLTNLLMRTAMRPDAGKRFADLLPSVRWLSEIPAFARLFCPRGVVLLLLCVTDNDRVIVADEDKAEVHVMVPLILCEAICSGELHVLAESRKLAQVAARWCTSLSLEPDIPQLALINWTALLALNNHMWEFADAVRHALGCTRDVLHYVEGSPHDARHIVYSGHDDGVPEEVFYRQPAINLLLGIRRLGFMQSFREMLTRPAKRPRVEQ